jgi:hypothetical protein
MSEDVSVRENCRSGLDLHRYHLGISELRVHPVRALVGLNDLLHRSVGSPLSRLSEFAVHESRRTYVCGRHLGETNAH